MLLTVLWMVLLMDMLKMLLTVLLLMMMMQMMPCMEHKPLMEGAQGLHAPATELCLAVVLMIAFKGGAAMASMDCPTGHTPSLLLGQGPLCPVQCQSSKRVQ